MYDPNFWHRVTTMLNQMDLAPSWIEVYPKHDLELLLRAAEYWEREANATRANLLLANTWERVQAIGFPDEEKAAKIRAAVAAELERREPKTAEIAPSKPQAAKGKLKELPRLEDVVKDAATFLPALWKALAREPNPLVTASGEAIKEGYQVARLTALAEALTADRVSKGYGIEDVFRMLCRRTGHPEPTRHRVKRDDTAYVFKEMKDRFLDVIKEVIENL